MNAETGLEVVNYELIPTLSFYLLFFLVLVTLHIFCCSYILEKKTIHILQNC